MANGFYERRGLGELRDLGDEALDYLKLRWASLRLTVADRMSTAAAKGLGIVVALVFVFTALAFLSIALALWVGQMLRNPALGFVIVGGGFLLIGVVFWLVGRRMFAGGMVRHFVDMFFSEEGEAGVLRKIDTVAELRGVRRELEVREEFAAERLAWDVSETLSPDNLIAMIAPPGSLVDRVIGGIGSGLTAVQALFGFVGSLWGGRHHKSHHAHAAHAARASHTTHARTATHHATRAPQIHPGEIEVEVELE
ncbi:MAG: phage holin family protein [Alistipes sp.]|jgi:hypothetical protein|nr:phage holin family protein [Alistipes sp.]